MNEDKLWIIKDDAIELIMDHIIAYEEKVISYNDLKRIIKEEITNLVEMILEN